MTSQAENLEVIRIVAPPGAHGDNVIDLVRTPRLTAHGTGPPTGRKGLPLHRPGDRCPPWLEDVECRREHAAPDALVPPRYASEAAGTQASR